VRAVSGSNLPITLLTTPKMLKLRWVKAVRKHGQENTRFGPNKPSLKVMRLQLCKIEVSKGREIASHTVKTKIMHIATG
jgi:hypothetical protein